MRLLEIGSLLTGAMAIALAAQLFARRSGVVEVPRTDPITHVTSGVYRRYVPAAGWFNAGLLFASLGLLALCLAGLWWRLRLSSTDEPVRELLVRNSRVTLSVASFVGGSLIAAYVRYRLGDINVTDFATGSAPLVGALLVGVLVDGLRRGGRIDRSRQVAVMYVLLGALATALGTLGSNGWFFGSCFIVIFGSLAASAYLVIDIVLAQ